MQKVLLLLLSLSAAYAMENDQTSKAESNPQESLLETVRQTLRTKSEMHKKMTADNKSGWDSIKYCWNTSNTPKMSLGAFFTGASLFAGFKYVIKSNIAESWFARLFNVIKLDNYVPTNIPYTDTPTVKAVAGSAFFLGACFGIRYAYNNGFHNSSVCQGQAYKLFKQAETEKNPETQKTLLLECDKSLNNMSGYGLGNLLDFNSKSEENSKKQE